MKKVYSKPEVTTNAYAAFEDVLTGGCNKNPGHSGCVYDVAFSPNGHGHDQNDYSAHNSLMPPKHS